MSDSNVSLVITQNRKLNIEFMQPPPLNVVVSHSTKKTIDIHLSVLWIKWR